MTRFLKRYKGHNVALAAKLVKTWKDDVAMVGGVRMEFSSDKIAEATLLPLGGRLYSREERVSIQEITEFFDGEAILEKVDSDYRRKHLPTPWD